MNNKNYIFKISRNLWFLKSKEKKELNNNLNDLAQDHGNLEMMFGDTKAFSKELLQSKIEDFSLSYKFLTSIVLTGRLFLTFVYSFITMLLFIISFSIIPLSFLLYFESSFFSSFFSQLVYLGCALFFLNNIFLLFRESFKSIVYNFMLLKILIKDDFSV